MTQPIGKILYLSSGSYSDYGITGFMRVLKEFSFAKEKAQYLEENPERTEVKPVPEVWKEMKRWKDRDTYEVTISPSNSGFIAYLVSKELVKELGDEIEEFHNEFGDN